MPSGDVKGYYSCLGVPSSATAAEIKAAFRRLAKETHPDSGAQGDGGARFRVVSEAYAVLSDPHDRAAYDSISATAPDRSTRRADIEPICCSVCGKVTAQPRYVVFRNVISVILVTTRNPIQGIYCSSCARTVSLKATLLSAFAGWWGFPWGPIFTFYECLRNAFGGESDRGNEERLLWHNAVAFAQRGDYKLAFGLAKRVEFATDRGIADSAKRLMAVLQAEGVTNTTDLKDPWALQPGNVLSQLLLLSVVPAIAVLLFMQPGSGGRTSLADYDMNAMSVTSPDYAGAPSPDYADASNSLDTLNSVAPPVEPVEPPCARPPGTGDRLEGRRLSGVGHVLEIANGASGDAIIKIRNADTGRLVTSFFVAQNTSASISGIPDGRYRFQYAFGSTLSSDCKSFANILSAGEFPAAESLITERQEEELGVRVRRMRLSYTLYSVPYGNTQPNPIDAASFNRD